MRVKSGGRKSKKEKQLKERLFYSVFLLVVSLSYSFYLAQSFNLDKEMVNTGWRKHSDTVLVLHTVQIDYFSKVALRV